jgi:serine/threonine-protein kinase
MGSREAGRVGAYRIVRHWASGDTSQIYLARREESSTLVALKRLRADRAHDREQAEWFARQIEVAERADHEHVVRSLESFEHEGVSYLAMEFLHGETLHDILRAIHPARRMPAAVALELVRRLALAVHHLHQLGAIHGDVCPANVIITHDGRVKLIDLGGRCQGSSAYAAPEQARGEAIDARADVFSLGLILFELLTGHRVRHGHSEKEIAAAAISGSVPRLSELVEADPELEALVTAAAANSRRSRFSDPMALADALLAYRESAVPGLSFESKLADFMEQNFSSRARSLDAHLAGNRSRLDGDRIVLAAPPLGATDPAPLIEAALRTHHTRASNPFAEPITGDIGWSNERTSPNDLAPAARRPSWLVAFGSMLFVIAALVVAFLLGESLS